MNSVDESVMDKDQLPKTPRCTAARWAERENPLTRPPRRTKMTLADGHEERDLDCICAGELSSAFGLPRWIGIELLCR